MCEVTTDNFPQILEEIKLSLQRAKFISIDTEFSALNYTEKISNSLFDTPAERYEKLRVLCTQIIPLQIGISAFAFNAEEHSYTADMYTFYVFQQKFQHINPKFIFQSSSLQFLCNHNFDFNKFIYKGLPYVNRIQEGEIKDYQQRFSLDDIDFSDLNFEFFVQEKSLEISKWLNDNAGNETLILPGIVQKYKHSLDILYFFHKHIRNRFNKQIWTSEENGEITIKKVSAREFDKLESEYDLDKSFLNDMLGFAHIFRYLVSLKKPIVGHNLLTDLMIMYHRFENPLPGSYKQFKKEIHNLLPVIYDTKCFTHELKRNLPENKVWDQNTLEFLYNYFKDGFGRHLALNSPLIQLNNPPNIDHFHNAGWDSYCTGYIFIRIAHIYATNKFDTKSKFMCSELLASISKYKNCVNVIRCSVPYIKLDGNDPESRRPPRLIIESVKNEPLDILKISSLLTPYGFVEIKPYSRGGKRAIIAVDNFGSARRILTQYRTHKEFQIKQYSIIKHSPVARAAIWSGVFVSGIVLALLVRSILKN